MENQILQQILTELKDLKEGQKSLGQDVSDLHYLHKQTDKRLDNLEKRTESIEKRTESIEQRTLSTDLQIENVIIPNIQLLAEGHAMIQEQIKGLSVIDSMQSDIATLKMAVKALSDELHKLKNAI